MKIAKILLSLAACMSFMTTTALSFTSNGITYSTLTSSEVEVTKCEGLSGEVNLPVTVTYGDKSYTVVAVGAEAFKSESEISKITLPSAVRKIGVQAFRECRGLTNFTIPASVTDIAPDAFLYCSGLQNFTVEDNNKSYSTYNGILMNKAQSQVFVCPPKKSETVTLPATVADVAEYAFSACFNIKEFKLSGESITASIEDGVLYNANKTTLMAFPRGKFIFETVKIPEGVTFILPRACEQVLMLNDIILPESLTEVSDYAFPNCNALQKIKFSSKLTRIGKGAFETIAATSLDLPVSLKVIDDAAFRYCRRLKSVIIPDAVETIGDEAFSMDNDLESVTFGKSLKTIGNKAFYYCSAIKTLDIPGTIDKLSEGAFSYCTGITQLTLHEGLTEIGKEGFTNLISLKSVNLPSTLTTIGENGFSACSVLESIKLPNTVTSVGPSAFMQCAALKSVQLSEGMKEIPYGMFAYCAALQAITIPSSIKIIGESSFSGCKALEEISFPEGTEEIGGSSFTGCQNLFKISFSSTVKTIGSQAFNYCDALINVFNYAQTPQKIGDDVFSVYRKLHVVEGREEAYKAAPVWKKFTITGDIAGINDVYGDNTQPVESYDLYGRRVNSDYRGIRIDVYPDGRRVKTIAR